MDSDCTESSKPIKTFYIEGAKATIAKWGPLNTYIYTGHEDGTIAIYDPATGQRLKSVKEHNGAIQDIQFSTADKGYFITASKDCTSLIFDTKSLDVLKKFTTERPVNSASISPIRNHASS